MRLQRTLTGAAQVLAAAAVMAMAPAPGAPTGGREQVVFSLASPLASDAVLLERSLSPLAAEAARRRLARSGKPLAPQSLDLRQERFAVYVPPKAPAAGYGLLVFVPPWDEARIPPGWASALDRHGLIYVAAARSGNAQSVVGRREALALTAAQNLMAQYRVDPARVYVAGFSGGSRVAQRLALGWPDLFRGAVLDAGSDPVDAGSDHLPSAALLAKVQDGLRLVLVSGELDSAQAMDATNLVSLRHACIFDVASRVTPRAGHEILDARAFAGALDLLERPAPPDASRLAACRANLQKELAADTRQAAALIGAGRRDEARKAILTIDRRFGGLAPTADVVHLADRCGCGLLER